MNGQRNSWCVSCKQEKPVQEYSNLDGLLGVALLVAVCDDCIALMRERDSTKEMSGR